MTNYTLTEEWLDNKLKKINCHNEIILENKNKLLKCEFYSLQISEQIDIVADILSGKIMRNNNDVKITYVPIFGAEIIHTISLIRKNKKINNIPFISYIFYYTIFNKIFLCKTDSKSFCDSLDINLLSSKLLFDQIVIQNKLNFIQTGTIDESLFFYKLNLHKNEAEKMVLQVTHNITKFSLDLVIIISQFLSTTKFIKKELKSILNKSSKQYNTL